MAREPGRLGCAAESRERGELVLGTASRVRRWLLVEQSGPWGRDALRESRLPAEVATALHRAARAHGVRVVLIRRGVAARAAAVAVRTATDPHVAQVPPATSPDRPASPETPSAVLVRSDRATRWAERIPIPHPSALLDLDLGLLSEDQRPGIGEPAGSLHLVCTNGRHDPCCADFGRPVVRALREAEVDVWESSHVGGDRFAANLVCLPTGVYFGRVPPEAAATIVRDHDAGLLALDHYRGRSCYPPLVQAAEVFARLELGERRLAELRPLRWQVRGDRASVELAHGTATVTAEVTRRPGPRVPLTCSPEAHAPWEHHLHALHRA